jgi:uncharacterized protein YaaR (DUF327 family)
MGGLFMKIRTDKPSDIRCREGRGIIARNKSTSVFSSELGRREEILLDNDRQMLADLKQSLYDAGEKLEKDPTAANFSAFCELIGKFAKKATSMAYRIDTLTGNMGSRPLDVLTIIDKEVDELYHLVMQGQRCRIQIAAKILSIKGLIVKLIA